MRRRNTSRSHAHLKGAKLVEANLAGTDLSRANLAGARLQDAVLGKNTFDDTDEDFARDLKEKD